MALLPHQLPAHRNASCSSQRHKAYKKSKSFLWCEKLLKY